MSKAPEYRAKAEECHRKGSAAADGGVKKHYLTLAAAWLEMAERSELTEKKTPMPSDVQNR